MSSWRTGFQPWLVAYCYIWPRCLALAVSPFLEKVQVASWHCCGLVVKILSQISQKIIVGQPYMNYGFPLANLFRWFHKNENTRDRQAWNSQTLLWSHYPYMSPPTIVSRICLVYSTRYAGNEPLYFMVLLQSVIFKERLSLSSQFPPLFPKRPILMSNVFPLIS